MTRLLLCCAIALAAACGSSRSTFARYPGAPAAFDRAGSEAKAVEIADKVFTASGGPGNWDKAKQVRWKQNVTSDGKAAPEIEEAWDRWNARHAGSLTRGDGSIKVGYELYGKFSMGFMQRGQKKEILDDESRTKALGTAKGVFNIDTAVLTMQFLMLEPGAKLKYVGTAKDDAGSENYDEVAVTFDDPLRKELEFHVVVDRTSNLIARIEMLKIGTTQKVGYSLKDWTTVNGLKFAASRTNLGYSGETTAITEIRVGEPEDELFIAPLY
ncbi:MAG: hypothetical protein ABI867_24915 [Kofleriaceae bacterium]